MLTLTAHGSVRGISDVRPLQMLMQFQVGYNGCIMTSPDNPARVVFSENKQVLSAYIQAVAILSKD